MMIHIILQLQVRFRNTSGRALFQVWNMGSIEA